MLVKRRWGEGVWFSAGLRGDRERGRGLVLG